MIPLLSSELPARCWSHLAGAFFCGLLLLGFVAPLLSAFDLVGVELTVLPGSGLEGNAVLLAVMGWGLLATITTIRITRDTGTLSVGLVAF